MKVRKKIRFILNPKAGSGLNDAITKLVVSSFSPHVFDIEILFTNHAKHAIELSRNAVVKKIDVVVAVGGDGTVNEIAQSLKNTETALAIIPTGSGNGFARHFKIPLKIEKAIQVIKAGKIISVDSLLINDQFCMNIAGIGFDAYIAKLFASYGKRGFASYAKLVSKEYFSFKERNYTVEFEDRKINTPAFLIAVANGSQFGNGAKIAPLASADDELIDVTILKKVTAINIPAVILKMFSGILCKSKYVEILKSKSFVITSAEEMTTHLDGEPNGNVKKLTAGISPKSVRLIIP